MAMGIFEIANSVVKQREVLVTNSDKKQQWRQMLGRIFSKQAPESVTTGDPDIAFQAQTSGFVSYIVDLN